MEEPKPTPRCVWPPKLPVLQSQEMLPLEAVPPLLIHKKISSSSDPRAQARSKWDPCTCGNSSLDPEASCWHPVTWFLWVIPHPWPPTLPSSTASLTSKKIPLYTPCRKYTRSLLSRYFWSFLFSSSFQWNTPLHSPSMHHMKQSHHFRLHFGLQMPGAGLTPFLIH